jgi:pimeloyl-ACP methyl ester carboxylesterase
LTFAIDLLPGHEERFVAWRGTRLKVYSAGTGPPLLLVHGYGGAAWNFAELVGLLPERRLVIPDLPGHGGSSPLPDASSLTAFADVLAAVCADEGLRETDVLGHSLGGTVALWLAARHPALVRRCILAAAAGITSSTRRSEAFITMVGVVQPGRIAGHGASRVARSRLLRRAVFELFEVANADTLSERAIHGFLQGPLRHTDALSAGRALVAGDPRPILPRVRCPVLLLWGARDRQVPLDDAFELARLLDAPLRVIADCGHLSIGERPDVCAAAIRTFLA